MKCRTPRWHRLDDLNTEHYPNKPKKGGGRGRTEKHGPGCVAGCLKIVNEGLFLSVLLSACVSMKPLSVGRNVLCTGFAVRKGPNSPSDTVGGQALTPPSDSVLCLIGI